jgi:hypothetical protein
VLKHHDIKLYEGLEVTFHEFLTLIPGGCQWPASRSGRLIPGNELPVFIRKEAAWASQSAWMMNKKETQPEVVAIMFLI